MPYKDPTQQRAAQAAHFQANKGKYAANSRAARERRREKVRALKENPCTDCGKTFPYYVMQFDHVDDNKVAGVARLIVNASWQAVLDEIAKCELVCANCHAIRTWKRLGRAADGV